MADELNVKEVRLLDADAPEAASYGVSQRLTVNARAAGPRLGRDVQTRDQGLEVGRLVGGRGRHRHRRRPGAGRRGSTPSRPSPAAGDGATAIGMLPRGGFVVLDTEVTPELAAEGVARDLVRAVQQARRDAGLAVSDRITLTITGSDAVRDAARTHERLIAAETLATSVAITAGTVPATARTPSRGSRCARPSPSRRRWAAQTRRVGADGPGTRPICADSAGSCGPICADSAGWLDGRHASLDLTADAVTLTEQLVDIESVSRQRAGDRRRGRGRRCAALAHLDGDPASATPWWPAPTSAAASGS